MQVNWRVIQYIWIILCVFLCLWASSFWNTRTHIPYRFFVNQADGGTIKIDLHSNATCSVSNIKSRPRRWDRQWSRSCTSSTSSSFPLSGSMGLPFLPSLEDWQALARAWLTACWCFISYHTHSTPCTGLGVSDSPCGSALQAAQHHTYKSQRCEKAHFNFVLVKL